MKSADYGIDGPVVLINLIIVAIVTAGLAVIAYYQILPFRFNLVESLITKFCVFIVTFNFACLLLYQYGAVRSVKSVKQDGFQKPMPGRGMKRFSMWDVDAA